MSAYSLHSGDMAFLMMIALYLANADSGGWPANIPLGIAAMHTIGRMFMEGRD